MELLMSMGIPAALFSAALGLFSWFFKKSIDKRENERKAREEAQEERRKVREENIEKLMLMIMKTSRATNVLAEATARAVQRIPDAHCNGDMTAALEEAEAIQKKEKDFMFDQGVQHIFGD